ncbi:MAG: helix-turn-helix domain-containing protein [Planctomycetes bacterium]|nr:helix-turn-helix domain-containing protein [Planctomycetota bacterium]
MKFTAIYLRVSTSNQKLDSQELELTRWIEMHQPTKVRFYRDTFTGTSMNRPAMDKLLDDLHRGRLDAIVIYRLDRLGRTASGLTKLFDELRRFRCNLISLRDNLDLSTPSGRLNANIIASVAAYETEVRAERVKAGQSAARASGKRWGGSAKGRLLKLKSEQVQAIVRMKASGEKVGVIARTVNVDPTTVYRVLQRVEDGDIKVA